MMPRDPRSPFNDPLLSFSCLSFFKSLHMWQLSKVDHRPSGIFRGVTCANSALLGVHTAIFCLRYKGTIECRTYELFWIIHFFACIFKKFYKLCILYYIITCVKGTKKLFDTSFLQKAGILFDMWTFSICYIILNEDGCLPQKTPF